MPNINCSLKLDCLNTNCLLHTQCPHPHKQCPTIDFCCSNDQCAGNKVYRKSDVYNENTQHPILNVKTHQIVGRHTYRRYAAPVFSKFIPLLNGKCCRYSPIIIKTTTAAMV